MPQFSPGAASRAVNARRAERQPAIALLTEVAALGQFAGNICGPSLHSVARDFGVTAGGAQLTIAIFFAAFAIAQLLLGPVSERHGRRPVMLTGIVLFLVGTAVCAAALSLDLLLLGRIVQAAGAAGAIVMSRAITRDCFDGPALTRTLATITIVFALVPGLTPLLGGALEHMAGWRASFVAVGLTGAVVLAAVITRLDETLKIRLLGSICVTGDHSRPETVWEAIKAFPDAGPHRIRRMLTEGAVRHDDRRARFIGSEDYEAAGGAILRDLFEDEGTGWFEDAGLLDRLVTEKLSQATDEVRAEGWKWVAYAPDFGHGASYRFRHVPGLSVALTPDEETEPQALIAEYENIQDTYANCDVIPDDEAERLDSLEAALATFKNRPVAFDAAEMAIAGARISLNRDGTLRIERGLVRPEDEPQAANGRDEQSRDTAVNAALYAAARVYSEDSDEEAQAVSTKLPDRLVANLTAQQTLVLRERLAANPEIAHVAVLHALVLAVFYTRAGDQTCLQIEARPMPLDRYEPHSGMAHISKRLDKRHAHWAGMLPTDPADLWERLLTLDFDNRAELLAYCAALTVNAVSDPWHGRAASRNHAGIGFRGDRFEPLRGPRPIANAGFLTS